MELTPLFVIEANGTDITSHIAKNLIALEFKDEEGSVSDELTLRVYGDFKRPPYQDELKLWLGYKESNIFYCGLFKVQSSERIDNHILQITATGADFSETLKQKKSRSFEKMSVKAICAQIASEHSLSLKSDYDDVFISHQAQNNESDLHFCKRLANELNAIFSVKNNVMIFIKKQKEGVKNEILPEFFIDATKVSSLSIKHSNKLLYRSCKAIWHDTKENLKQEVVVGSGEPQLILEGSFKDRAEAKLKAEAKLQRAKAGIKTGSLSCAGVEIYAGGKLILSNTLGGEDDETYSIKSVIHSFSEGGWSTSVEFEN